MYSVILDEKADGPSYTYVIFDLVKYLYKQLHWTKDRIKEFQKVIHIKVILILKK